MVVPDGYRDVRFDLTVAVATSEMIAMSWTARACAI